MGEMRLADREDIALWDAVEKHLREALEATMEPIPFLGPTIVAIVARVVDDLNFVLIKN